MSFSDTISKWQKVGDKNFFTDLAGMVPLIDPTALVGRSPAFIFSPERKSLSSTQAEYIQLGTANGYSADFLSKSFQIMAQPHLLRAGVNGENLVWFVDDALKGESQIQKIQPHSLHLSASVSDLKEKYTYEQAVTFGERLFSLVTNAVSRGGISGNMESYMTHTLKAMEDLGGGILAYDSVEDLPCGVPWTILRLRYRPNGGTGSTDVFKTKYVSVKGLARHLGELTVFINPYNASGGDIDLIVFDVHGGRTLLGHPVCIGGQFQAGSGANVSASESILASVKRFQSRWDKEGSPGTVSILRASLIHGPGEHLVPELVAERDRRKSILQAQMAFFGLDPTKVTFSEGHHGVSDVLGYVYGYSGAVDSVIWEFDTISASENVLIAKTLRRSIGVDSYALNSVFSDDELTDEDKAKKQEFLDKEEIDDLSDASGYLRLLSAPGGFGVVDTDLEISPMYVALSQLSGDVNDLKTLVLGTDLNDVEYSMFEAKQRFKQRASNPVHSQYAIIVDQTYISQGDGGDFEEKGDLTFTFIGGQVSCLRGADFLSVDEGLEQTYLGANWVYPTITLEDGYNGSIRDLIAREFFGFLNYAALDAAQSNVDSKTTYSSGERDGVVGYILPSDPGRRAQCLLMPWTSKRNQLELAVKGILEVSLSPIQYDLTNYTGEKSGWKI